MSVNQETFETSMRGLEEALYGVERKLGDKADGTNWTVADSLSNIAFQLERIADSLEKTD